MPAIPTDHLACYRTFPHGLRRFLSICPRNAVFSAQVNGTPTRDSFSNALLAIPYDHAVGSWTDVRAGMTLDVGTTPGSADVGRVRIRTTPDASNLYIAETSYGALPVQDDHYLTVRQEFRLWPVLLKILPTGATFVEYKDATIAYTDQNRYPVPIANIDARPAGFVDAGQSYRTVTLNGSGVAVADSTAIASYLWHIGDGTLVSGYTLSDATIRVRFPVGFRYVYLTVTDTNGRTGVKAWPIWVHTESGDDAPLTAFEVTKDERGEWREMAFLLFGAENSVTSAVIPQGALVCYWEQATFGGRPAPESYIDQYLGWATEDATRLRWDRSEYMLQTAGAGWWLNQYQGFGGQVEHANSPANWRELYRPTTSRLCYYALQYHSTAFLVCNASPEWGTGTVLRRGHNFSRASLWQQVKAVASGIIGIHVATDSLNRLWLRREASYLATGSRSSVATVCSLTEADWNGEEGLEIGQRFYPAVSLVRGEGYSFDGTTDRYYKSRAYGLETALAGTVEDMPGQALDTVGNQTTLNTRTGMHFARLNNATPEITLQMAGNFDIAEPAWQERLLLNHSRGNVRGLTLNNQYAHLLRVSVRHSNDPQQAAKTLSWVVTFETAGEPGETVNIDDERIVPEDIADGFADYAPADGLADTELPDQALVCGETTDAVAPPVAATATLADLDAAQWRNVRAGLPAGALDARCLALDGFSPGEQAVSLITEDALYYAPLAWTPVGALGWDERQTRTDVITAGYSAHSGDGPFYDLVASFYTNRQYAIIRRQLTTSGEPEARLATTTDQWATMSYAATDLKALFSVWPPPSGGASDFYRYRLAINHATGRVYAVYFLYDVGSGDPTISMHITSCAADLSGLMYLGGWEIIWSEAGGWIGWPPPAAVIEVPYEGNNGDTKVWASHNAVLRRWVSGVTWDTIATPGVSGNIAQIRTYLQDADVMVIASTGGTLLTSRNADAPTPTFASGSLPGTGTVHRLYIHPFNSDILFLLRGAALWISLDFGASWTNASGNLTGYGGLSALQDLALKVAG